MKSETILAIAALPTSLATGLGSAWIGVHAAMRQQREKYRREDREAMDEALSELLLAATQFSARCHHFQIRWTDAASPLLRAIGARRALDEFSTNILGSGLDRLFKAALVVSRLQGPEQQPLRQAAETLTDKAGELMGALLKNGTEYEDRNVEFQEALKTTRQAVDVWDSRPQPSRWRRLARWCWLLLTGPWRLLRRLGRHQ